jgi:hypothetical protein
VFNEVILNLFGLNRKGLMMLWRKHGLLFPYLCAPLTHWLENSVPQLRVFRVGAIKKLGILTPNSASLGKFFTTWRLLRKSGYTISVQTGEMAAQSAQETLFSPLFFTMYSR